MTNDWSMGEVVRRLDRIEQHLGDMGLRLVPVDLHTRDRAETERRFAELERDVADERQARKDGDKDIRDQLDRQNDRQGTSWRTAIYSGVIPSALFLITILLQLKSGGGK
ncbi:hypothetical protein [Actinomadura hibisca]|uniref:hypothetical protein n=1 Tax=Actinomadura hibisca TaxID=68565 RepID=UPI00082BEC83|nr:hypothetical protein [Actinomadura hibisca]